LLAHWVHNLDPFIFRIHGEIGVRWYGAAYLLGIAAGYWMIRRWQSQDRVPLRREEILDFVIITAIMMMIGGRLGHCVMYSWDTIGADLHFAGRLIFGGEVTREELNAACVRVPLIDTWLWIPFPFRLWQGGMASHGGMIGFLVGVGLFAHWRKRSFLVLIDTVAAVAPIGVIAGRIANFINGELWGRPSDVAWAVIFPKSPTIDGALVPRHPSQLYAVALEGVACLMVAMLVHSRHRRPGLTAGAVTITYSLGRFLGEFFREPDEGYALYFGWMSKGQLFTIPLFVLGVALLAFALWRAPKPEEYPAPRPVERDDEAPAEHDPSDAEPKQQKNRPRKKRRR